MKVRLYYRARRNSSDEKRNIELPRHATIAILDATLFLRDFHLFVDEIHLTLKKKRSTRTPNQMTEFSTNFLNV